MNIGDRLRTELLGLHVHLIQQKNPGVVALVSSHGGRDGQIIGGVRLLLLNDGVTATPWTEGKLLLTVLAILQIFIRHVAMAKSRISVLVNLADIQLANRRGMADHRRVLIMIISSVRSSHIICKAGRMLSRSIGCVLSRLDDRVLLVVVRAVSFVHRDALKCFNAFTALEDSGSLVVRCLQHIFLLLMLHLHFGSIAVYVV